MKKRKKTCYNVSWGLVNPDGEAGGGGICEYLDRISFIWSLGKFTKL